MKKTLLMILVLLGTIVLTGCGQQPMATAPITEQQEYFTNSELGIKFAYGSNEYKGKLNIEENKIIYKYPGTENIQYIELFTKEDTQTIEDAILDIVYSQGKDIKNCKVVNKGEYWANPKYNEYVLDLANPEITYTEQELNEIKLAETEAEKDGGSFDGDWKKQTIYNRHLVENCSEYANPLGLATSKTIPSRFIYNNKTRFVFLPGLSDPSFYRENSIELLD